jgi:hypothetical protein
MLQHLKVPTLIKLRDRLLGKRKPKKKKKCKLYHPNIFLQRLKDYENSGCPSREPLFEVGTSPTQSKRANYCSASSGILKTLEKGGGWTLMFPAECRRSELLV